MNEIEDPNVEPYWRTLYKKILADIPDTGCDREESREEILARALFRADKLLSTWARFAKAFQLYLPNGELSDYDDELAGEVLRTAKKTLEWRDGAGTWT